MFLKNKNIIFKIRRSKVTDYAALSTQNGDSHLNTQNGNSHLNTQNGNSYLNTQDGKSLDGTLVALNQFM